MRKVADVLERAADLIEPEGAWTQREAALDKDGSYVEPFSPRAVCWCIEGAISAVIRKPWLTEGFVRHPAVLFLYEHGVDWYWNDVRCLTQSEAVAKLRELAKLARENPDA